MRNVRRRRGVLRARLRCKGFVDTISFVEGSWTVEMGRDTERPA